MHKTIHVAVAVIIIKNKVLIAKRAEHLHKGGYWEFPGGKVEPNETIEDALVRECQEELNIIPTQTSSLQKIEHYYPEKKVLLDVWLVEDYLGVPQGLEGQPLVWIYKQDLNNYKFPEANQAILEALMA
ncbi:8-oxo-dGTP diphosphatase MutT [Kangiella sp. HZ709]|uniref:8-oxo-dGTP diphosphatase MutT n=1 Tax=Kangiella sp. HZ709 TaxID=2666328 RepID=UPI0012AF83F3|nr:8-oxo-dGTP diphosphatase MutT [Kangiella sp. HZ709]MRX27412.1 8-oxo-dGTP diphosphatase MutT [Kangiella sp. HZ709]